MFTRTTLTVIFLAVIVGAIGAVKVLQIKTLMSQRPVVPPESVATYQVKQEIWQLTLPSVGSLSAVRGVTVSAELDGKIVEIDIDAGKSVKAGEILVRQDTSVEEAELRAAEALVDLGRVNLKRTRDLLAKATVSQSQFDTDNATYEQAVAAVDNIKATISKKTIRAPFSGDLGIRLVNLGQDLKAGDSIVSLQALNPIFVDFYLPQQELVQVQTGLTVRLSGDAVAGSPVEGRITAISPDVDVTTRNVRVQATVLNPDKRLHPGMFVDVTVELPVEKPVLAIPDTAVIYAPYGDSVYLVDSSGDGKQPVAKQQVVRLGTRRGDFVAVISGLKPGDTVVTSGGFKLRPGVPLVVNNSLAPDAQTAPVPKDS